MRARPRSVAGLVAAFVLPTQLVVSWLQRDFLSTLNFDEFDPQTGTFGNEPAEFGFFAGGPVATILPLVVLPFIGVGLTHLVLGWRDGVERSILECLRYTLARTHVILAALVLSKIIQVLSVFMLTPATMLIAVVLGAEDLGPIEAWKRSWALARARLGQLVVLLLLLMVVNVLLSSALSTLPAIGAMLLADWGWVVFFALTLVSSSILNILGVGTSILAYLDIRNRVEGADLERRVKAIQADQTR